MLALATVVSAYLLGSIPFGYVIVRLMERGDVRESGSGGTGATNVTRRAGKVAGLLTLTLDALKGVLAVMLARWLLAPDFTVNWWVAVSSVAVIAGHIFPVWLNFRGGKGVATGGGVFLSLAPLALAVAVLVFLLVVWKTRYVSLGSIMACALMPLLIWWFSSVRAEHSWAGLFPLLASALASSALIIFMHRANLERLLHGSENKLP